MNQRCSLKYKIVKNIGAGLLLAGIATTTSAESLYVNAGIGPAFATCMKLKSLTGVGSLSGTEADFKTGLRGNISIGYQATESLSFEMETGFIWNQVDRIKGPGGSVNTSALGVDANIYQVPILFKSKYTFLPQYKWRPYFGAGLGPIATIGTIESRGSGLIPAGSTSGYDFTLAYQLEAGVDVELTQNVSLGVGYKFLRSLNHKLGDLRTEEISTHSLEAQITCKF